MVEEMKIDDISISKEYTISFRIDGSPYFLSFVENQQGLFELENVNHDFESVCYLCKWKNRRNEMCTKLDPYKKELFRQIMNTPEVQEFLNA